MDSKGFLIASFSLGLGSVMSYLIFRRKSWSGRLSRLPLFRTCALPLFYLGVANLPVVFEPVFTKITGHSIWDMYKFPKSASGTEFSETWWLARWLSPIQNTVSILVPIGIAWALINAATGRERELNLIGATVGAILVLLAVFLAATIGQFW